MRLCQFLGGLLQTLILAAEQKTPVLAEFLMEFVKDYTITYDVICALPLLTKLYKKYLHARIVL
jgi:hypothetical protein